ncbi:MAG: hypothetical protein ACLTS6_12175 [Anaerobutyricum sp.]
MTIMSTTALNDAKKETLCGGRVADSDATIGVEDASVVLFRYLIF